MAERLLRAFLTALGQPPQALDGLVAAPRNHRLKIIHYPGQPDGQSSQGVGAHKDGGLLTLLLSVVTIPMRSKLESFVFSVRGDLAVFDRGGGKGHVGFFDGFNEDGTIRVLGGNQGDKVSVANFGTDNLIGYRRAPNAMLKGADFNPNAMIAAQEEPMLPDYQGINIGLAQLRGLQAQRRLYG